MFRHHQALLLVVALAAGCSDSNHISTSSGHSTVVSSHPRAEADAGVIVTNLAHEMKIKLEDYQQPTVTFDSVRHEWEFFYRHKPPGMPGGHFTIIVDESGKTRLYGGA